MIQPAQGVQNWLLPSFLKLSSFYFRFTFTLMERRETKLGLKQLYFLSVLNVTFFISHPCLSPFSYPEPNWRSPQQFPQSAVYTELLPSGITLSWDIFRFVFHFCASFFHAYLCKTYLPLCLYYNWSAYSVVTSFSRF